MANSTPFYDDLFTTTASVFHTNNSADDWSLTQCQDYSGFAYYRNYGVVYTWDGLPVRSSVNDGVNGWVAGSQIVLALLGIVLNIHCARVIVRNPNVSWPVRFYLLFDCLSRGIDSICFLYKCYCVLSWECVNPFGSPLSGLMINKIVTAFYLAMIYSMQMIANGLCTNRDWERPLLALAKSNVLSGSKTWFDDSLTSIYLDRTFGSISFGKGLLVWDSFRCHISKDSKKKLKSLKLDTAVVPGGTTKLLQPADVSWNRPFNSKIRHFYEQEMMKAGNLKASPMEVYLQWIVDSWKSLPKELIEKSFKAGGITIDVNGLEDNQITVFTRIEDRIFAVFFDGRFYPQMERIAFIHSLFLWIIPVAIYCYQIGDVVNKETGFVCYGCWYFSPLHYCTLCFYSWDDLAQWFLSYLDDVMYGLFGATFALDLVTLWKVRQITKRSSTSRRADVRLSIMLVTTHFITVTYLIVHYSLQYFFQQGLPIFYYLLLEVYPFASQSIFAIVIWIFMTPPNTSKNLQKASNLLNGKIIVK